MLRVDATAQRQGFTRHFSLTAASGECVAIVGGIGSGKSTLLALVAGELRAAAGSVTVHSQVWDEGAAFVPPHRRSVGHVPQSVVLEDDRTALELVGAAIGVKARREAAASVLAELGLGAHVVDRPLYTLSGGETRRVALVAAVVRTPTVLLLDEPFVALDKRSGLVVRDWLAHRLAQRVGPTLLVSAEPADVARFCNRTVELAN